MASPTVAHEPAAFQKALDDFKSDLSQEEQDQITFTTLPALQRSIKEIQDKHWKARNGKNMDRLRRFLEAMEQYSKIIEGPMKFLLQVTSNHVEAFDNLLEVYKDLGESLPIVDYYAIQLEKRKLPHIQQILSSLFSDVLKFHHAAYKYFKQKALKHIFSATWKTYRTRFQSIIDDIKRRKELLESGANAIQFQMLEESLLKIDLQSKQQRERDDREKMAFVRDWLNSAPVQEDLESKYQVCAAHPDSCRWILDNPKFQKWQDMNSAHHTFWIHGIPGAGKSTLAAFIVNHLQEGNTAVLYFFCKNHDQDRDSCQAVLRALIDQIVHQNETAFQYVLDQVTKSGEKPLRTLKRSQEILQTCLKVFSSVYIVIDGIDECNVLDKRAVATFMKSTVSKLQDDGINVYCLFSSQHDEDTAKLFRGITTLDIAGDGLNNDIKNFCLHESEAIKLRFELLDTEMKNIAHQVSIGAAGMFLYAKLVMYNLRSQSKLISLRNEMQPGVFPKGLEQAYSRIVVRVLNQESPLYKDTLQLFGLIICSKRTLRWFEIQGAVSIDLESRKVDYNGRRFRVSAKELCGSLVEVKQSGAVELVHTTARSFLIEHGYVNARVAELDLCQLCVRYLAFPCFMIDPHEKATRALVAEGAYIFANYAIAHWSEHLTNVIAYEDQLSDGEKRDVLEGVQQLLVAQFDAGFPRKFATQSIKAEFSIWNQEPHFDRLVEAVTSHRLQRGSDIQLRKVYQDLPYMKGNLLIGQKHLEIRRLICRTMDSHEMYGDNLHYCYRMDCDRFFDGFPDQQSQEEHEFKHSSISCPSEGCLASFRGSSMHNELSKHINEVHGEKDDSFRPIGQPQSFSQRVCELIRYVDVHHLKEALLTTESGKFMFFADSYHDRHRQSGDHISKQAWKWAIANPNEAILQVLIQHTVFKDTNAQAWILYRATHTGNKDLVERFLNDEFDCGRTNRLQPAWRRAIKAAIADDQEEILDMLLGRAMQIERERPSKDRLRGYCVSAARDGQLAIVRLLVSKYGCNPFQTTKGDLRSAMLTTRDWRPEEFFWNKRSAFCHAVRFDRVEIVKHLLQQASDQQLTSLFRKESRFDLILLAASNGYEDVILALKSSDVPRQVIEDALLRARFYNMVRAGGVNMPEEIEKACKMDEIPDRKGQTILMHAAFRGLAPIVESLVLAGADLSHKTHRYGDALFDRPVDAEELALAGGHPAIAGLLSRAKCVAQKVTKFEVKQERVVNVEASRILRFPPELITLE